MMPVTRIQNKRFYLHNIYLLGLDFRIPWYSASAVVGDILLGGVGLGDDRLVPPIRHIISCAPRPNWVFRPFITIQTHPRLAHHRLIRPGVCVALKAPWGHFGAHSLLRLQPASDCFFQQQLQGLWWSSAEPVLWFQPPLIALWWN